MTSFHKLRSEFKEYGGNVHTISNLRTKFEITIPGESIISIYNLSDAREKLFVSAALDSAKPASLSLFHNDELLKAGEIATIESFTRETERITDISIVKFSAALKTLFVPQYRSAVSVRQIIRDAVAVAGLICDEESLKSSVAEHLTGTTLAVFNQRYDYLTVAPFLTFSFAGSVGQLLNHFKEQFGIDWIEEDGTIFFSLIRAPARLFGFRLSKLNGLIDKPANTREGLIVKSTLNKQAKLYHSVRLISGNFSGSYKIAKITHKGDDYDGDFVTEMTLL